MYDAEIYTEQFLMDGKLGIGNYSRSTVYRHVKSINDCIKTNYKDSCVIAKSDFKTNCIKLKERKIK